MLRENLERNFGFILHDVARLLRTTYDRRVRDLGLTRSQWWVLTHLFRKDGITQSELAETLELEKPSLGRLLDRLETKGWVRRAADPKDRRAKRVFLTDAAQAPMQVMREVAAGVREDALAGLERRRPGSLCRCAAHHQVQSHGPGERRIQRQRAIRLLNRGKGRTKKAA